MSRQTGLTICAWHNNYWEVPVGKVLVFRRKSRRQKNRFITVPDNDKVKQRQMSHGICRACSRKFMGDNIAAFRAEEIRQMARCIKRR